jgi:hypothetical protein
MIGVYRGRDFLPPCTEWYEIPGQAGHDGKARMQAGQKGKSLFQIHKVQDFIPDVLFADLIEDFVAHARI